MARWRWRSSTAWSKEQSSSRSKARLTVPLWSKARTIRPERGSSQLLPSFCAHRRPERNPTPGSLSTAKLVPFFAATDKLLQFPAPATEQRTLPCACGHQASYRELRSKPVLTAVGAVKVSRPYYLCSHCHTGQFPADVELDIEDTETSPGVRRMQAIVGQDAPFDHGRQQMKLLADLEVTTKAVERTAEAIGADIAAREHVEIHRAAQ